MGLTEIKLYDELEVKNIGQNQYNLWKRSRTYKKGGGVMFLVKKSLKVVEIEHGNGLAEAIKIGVENTQGKKRQCIVMYVPPKTNAWSNKEYEIMIKDTVSWTEKVLRGDKLIMMGDFNFTKKYTTQT